MVNLVSFTCFSVQKVDDEKLTGSQRRGSPPGFSLAIATNIN